MSPLFAIFDISPVTMMIVGVLAVLLFGERLPEVARSVGKSLMQFKQGLNGIQDEIRNAVDSATSVNPSDSTSSYSGTTSTAALPSTPEMHEEATAPKFEPPAN